LFCLIIHGLLAFQAGEEFQVNTYTDENQLDSTIAMDKKGNFVITWASCWGQDGSGYGIFAQRFNKQGKAIGPEFQVNTYTDGDQWDPAIAMDKKGNFVITWSSLHQDSSGVGIFAQRFNKRGKAIGPEFQVNTYFVDYQVCPAIAMDKKGNYVITWHSYEQDGSYYGIFAQRFSKQGIALGSEFQVNTYTYGEQILPAIAMDDKGNFVIAWESWGVAESQIFVQRYNKRGKAIGPEFQVDTYTLGQPRFPAIAMDKKGNFVITWENSDWGALERGIFAQRFNSRGKAIGSEFQVNTYTDCSQSIPAIAMDDKGNFVITWENSNQDGSSGGIFAQRFNSREKAIGPEFQVNTYSDGSQWNSAIAMDKKGNFVITWTSKDQDGSGQGIFAKRFKN